MKFDVVVAGGGAGGCAAAAAMSQLGYRVAIVEPGIDASRRLAGELVHDTGAAALAELGLLDALHAGDRMDVTGFSVRFGGAADSKVVRLEYRRQGEPAQSAFAMEHGLIRHRLLEAVGTFRGVTVLDGSRITGVDLSDGDSARVRVSSQTGEIEMRPRLLVGADGASSPVSRLAGIEQTRRRVSTLFGLLLQDKSLPDPGYGHIFLGGAGPVLAYPVSRRAVRIMFDVPGRPAGSPAATACRDSLHTLPEPFRCEVASGLETSPVVASASYSAAAREIARGRLVLVGDAAGCCHPLTATGLTVCASDAVRLRDAVRDAAGDFSRALPLYARRRRAPQRTRLVLARALYDVFCAQTPESRLMRGGLAEYWNGRGQRQAKSMALVSMAEGRLRVLLMEVAHILVSSFGARMSGGSRALLGLSRLVLRHAGETLRTT